MLKDVFHRRRKVAHAALGVAIGVMTVITTLTVAYAAEHRLHAELERYGPNLTVSPSTENLAMSMGSLSLGSVTVGENHIPQETVGTIQALADDAIRRDMGLTGPGPIATVAPRLYVASSVNDVPVTFVGVVPEKEIQIRSWWKIAEGSYLVTPDGVLAGALSAAVLDLAPGDSIAIAGHGLTVEGVLEESGAEDDYALFVSLDTMQSLSGKTGVVSTVDVRALCNGCPVEMIAASLNSEIPGVRAVAIRQVAEAEMGVQAKLRGLMLGLAGITLFVGLFGVANVMSGMVTERRKDIGIMRAIGASRQQIVRIVMYEAVVLGVLGGVAGYAAGLLLARLVGPLVLDGVHIVPVFMHLPIALALAVMVASTAALQPALAAARMRVADAVRV
ncbi:MAG: ABC transporter permease [Chloroflexota bacterium]